MAVRRCGRSCCGSYRGHGPLLQEPVGAAHGRDSTQVGRDGSIVADQQHRSVENGAAFSTGGATAKRAVTPTLSHRERGLSMQRVGWFETAPPSKPNSTVAWKTAQPFPLGLRSEARPHPNPLPRGEGAIQAGGKVGWDGFTVGAQRGRSVENGAAFSTEGFAAKRALTPTLSQRERRLSAQTLSTIAPATPKPPTAADCARTTRSGLPPPLSSAWAIPPDRDAPETAAGWACAIPGAARPGRHWPTLRAP